MTTVKDREFKKLKLREKKQREALAVTIMALREIQFQCEESLKHYKEQGWNENKTIAKTRDNAKIALYNVERLKAEFMEDAPKRPGLWIIDMEE